MSIAAEAAPLRLAPDELTIPVERDVFTDHPEAAFYIGVIATPGVVHDARIYQATSRFRAGVYIDQMNFLSENSRLRGGGETDADDNRSVHFSVVENRGASEPPRVVGCSRLILKDDKNVPLPVEHFFPEYFDESPAPLGSTEGSRLIARHPNRGTQGIIALGLIRAMTNYSVEHGKQPIYAVVERGLATMFDRMKLPNTRLTELKYLDEYRTKNMALAIEPERIATSIQPENHVHSDEVKGFFEDSDVHNSLGFFNETLTENMNNDTRQSI